MVLVFVPGSKPIYELPSAFRSESSDLWISIEHPFVSVQVMLLINIPPYERSCENPNGGYIICGYII